MNQYRKIVLNIQPINPKKSKYWKKTPVRKAPFKRPPAVYDNPSHEEIIKKYVKS